MLLKPSQSILLSLAQVIKNGHVAQLELMAYNENFMGHQEEKGTLYVCHQEQSESKTNMQGSRAEN